jgi:hypothetical protein
MKYRIKFTARYLRGYKKLPQGLRRHVDKALRLVTTDPNHPSLRLHRVQDTNDVWEISPTMSIRITLRFEGDLIEFRNVGPHDDVLRPPY